MKSSGKKPIRIVVVDDEAVLAKSLVVLLEKDAGLRIEGYATDSSQGFDLCVATEPDLAFVDVEMPNEDGITMAQRLLDKLPAIRIIIMTGRVDPYTAWRAGQIGAHGLVDKTIDTESLGAMIRLVVTGHQFTSPKFQQIKEQWLAEPDAFQKILTNRELAVLKRLTDGLSDQDIGQQLAISAETVACHRKSLRKKLELHDDRSLMAYGREWGIYGLRGKENSAAAKSP